MGDDWLWPAFLADLQSGAVDSAVDRVAEQTGMPVLVGMDTSYYKDMEPGNPYAEINQRDELLFEARGSSLELINKSFAVNLLRDAAEAQTLADLGRGLASAPDQDWTWTNLVLGVAFKMAPLQPDAELPPDAWNEARLWDRVLTPWLPWVR
jgi:hypothetical protein